MPLLGRDLSSFILEETPEIYEELQELGLSIYQYFDTESLQTLAELLENLGLKKEAEKVWQHFYISEEYWAERYWRDTGEPIMYDPRARRWRSMITGRWVPDPYTYLWGEE